MHLPSMPADAARPGQSTAAPDTDLSFLHVHGRSVRCGGYLLAASSDSEPNSATVTTTVHCVANLAVVSVDVAPGAVPSAPRSTTQSPFFGHATCVRALAVHPNRVVVASASEDALLVWDALTLDILASLSLRLASSQSPVVDVSAVEALSFSADGAVLAVVGTRLQRASSLRPAQAAPQSSDSTLVLWDWRQCVLLAHARLRSSTPEPRPLSVLTRALLSFPHSLRPGLFGGSFKPLHAVSRKQNDAASLSEVVFATCCSARTTVHIWSIAGNVLTCHSVQDTSQDCSVVSFRIRAQGCMLAHALALFFFIWGLRCWHAWQMYHFHHSVVDRRNVPRLGARLRCVASTPVLPPREEPPSSWGRPTAACSVRAATWAAAAPGPFPPSKRCRPFKSSPTPWPSTPSAAQRTCFSSLVGYCCCLRDLIVLVLTAGANNGCEFHIC